MSQDNGFSAYPITRYRQESVATSEQWIINEMAAHRTHGFGKVGLWLKETAELIGMAGLTAWQLESEDLVDLTYRISSVHWGKGFGYEAAYALTKFAFDSLKLNELTATITPDNVPSIKLAERLGMTFNRRIMLKSVATNLYRLPREQFAL